jgi:hypothetical protein
MAGDQQFERFAIICGDEAIEQHGVCRRHGFVAQAAEVALQRLDRWNGYASILVDSFDSA